MWERFAALRAIPAFSNSSFSNHPPRAAHREHSGGERAATPSESSGTFRWERNPLTGEAEGYRLFVPSAPFGKPMPLVVMLHGCSQDPDDFAAGTRMNVLASEQGFLVLYPRQTAAANSSRCWNWFLRTHQHRGAGEPHRISEMVSDVIRRYEVDPMRIYIAGLSAGAAMALIVAREYPELFAAVGVHSGLRHGAANDVPSAFAAMRRGAPAERSGSTMGTPPVIVFHGDQDSTVHPVNGEQIVDASRAGWPARPSSAAAPEAIVAAGESGGRRFTLSAHQDVDGRVRAEHWLVHGAAHAWSGGSASGSYTDERGPDATREMWRFFRLHQLSHPTPD